jgi:MFS family permease
VDGFLDLTRGGRTELRIHGVSGTPPEGMLNHPHPRPVAGDGVAGFYRRWWPGGQPPPTCADRDEEHHRHREAYSWGGLTSGAASRALWLLLLPFMLLNVAFYMTPRPPLQDPGSTLRSLLRKVSAAIQRLLALSLTGSLVLSAIGVAMDLVGWQCGRAAAGCGARHGWLAFLTSGWLDAPNRQLAVTSLLPAAVVALLWHLGRTTWQAHEQTRVPEGPTDLGEVLLEDRGTWNGGQSVGRLRAAHVTGAFSLVAVLLLAPLARRSGFAQALLVVHLVIIGVTVAAVARFHIADRSAPSDPAAGPGRRRVDRVPLAAAALYLLTAVLAFALPLDPGRSEDGGLPWFTGAVVWTLLAQAVLLAALLAVTTAIAASTRGSPRLGAWTAVDGRQGKDIVDRWALAGLGTPVLVMLGWLLAGGFAAGLALRVAGFLGTPAATGQSGPSKTALVVPAPYFWAAGLSLILLAATVVAALYLLVRWWAARDEQLKKVEEVYQRPGTPVKAALDAMADERPVSSNERTEAERLRNIAGLWARAALTDHAGRVLGWLLAGTAVLLLAGGAAYLWWGAAWLPTRFSWLTTGGSFAIGLGALGLVMVGRNAYRNPGLRRTVGILWDLGTFWPRATHPLAPPCYTERVIPDLLGRLEWLAPTEQDCVVLSAHSQGSIIAGALVLQLDPTQRRRVRLLTYGSPLQRLYGRWFPAWFGPVVLRRVGQVLPARRPAPAGPAANGSAWPWRNLFRPSDPIGGAVFYLYEISTIDNGDVDWQLMDPVVDPPEGDRAWPRAYGHSDYFRDPAFDVALKFLEDWHKAGGMGAPSGV